jgi:alkanesulfonate monooxygenase SsuD/methylene tetrahydromethanopterin reductase-like flavin-dependent oxidoreductase (luciferase family)
MRFGFFDQLPCAPGYTERQRYDDILAQIELGDRVGYDTVWLGELHFSRAFSVLANPLMVLAAAAQRTSRIRLGTAVTLLPMHNPAKIAEDAATADLLSGGRLEFGVGRGTAPLHYAGYDIPMEESRERFDEALDYIIGAWTNERFTFAGKYFRAHDLPITPRPLQTPHPTIRVAANSPDTFPFAARRRLAIFATPLINPPDKLKEGLAVYRGGLPAGVHGDTAMAFPVHVTTSRAQAREDSEHGLLRFLHRGGGAAATARRRRHQEFRGVPAGFGADRQRDLCRYGPRDGRLRRPGLLHRAGAPAAARIRHGRVHLLLQPGRLDGPRHGAAVDDALCRKGDAAFSVTHASASGNADEP